MRVFFKAVAMDMPPVDLEIGKLICALVSVIWTMSSQ